MESLFAQTCSIKILARDDGSGDRTRAILTEYEKYPNFQWYAGNNIGPSGSFLELLRNSPEADYYAFCDQDDVWLPDKLMTAVSALEKEDNPIKCYSSSYIPVDEHLQRLDIQMPDGIMPQTLTAVLVTNSATGCTMVLSRELRDRLNAYEPRHIYMHDWWSCLVCLTIGGKTIQDPDAHILYRQHGGNIVGAKESVSDKIKRRLFGKGKFIRRSDFARELLQGYKTQMDDEVYAQVSAMANYDRNLFSRLCFAFRNPFWCGDRMKDVLFRFDALTGRL